MKMMIDLPIRSPSPRDMPMPKRKIMTSELGKNRRNVSKLAMQDFFAMLFGP